MAEKEAIQPSVTTTVKAVADSTQPRPRRSGVNYTVKNSAKKQLPCRAPKVRKTADADTVPSKRKAKRNADRNVPSGRHTTIAVVERSRKELKRKERSYVGPRKKKPKTVDSARYSEDERPGTSDQPTRPAASGDQSGGCKDRLLMRQWLEAEADRGNIPGLRWFDSNERLIQITWRHGSRSEWSTSDVIVFKCWAQHTGRYDASKNDYKRWKANFRCALNSLQDVEEVPEKRSTKCSDPYKVFRLLPAIPPKKRRRESIRSACSSSAESTFTLTAEEAVQTDDNIRDFADPTNDTDAALTRDLFQHLMPLSNSSGCRQILAWPSVDPVYGEAAAETLETIDVPLTDLESFCTDIEPMNQLQFQSLPPSPPSPAPFNDAIPVPVQDLIESSEEFQTVAVPNGDTPVLGYTITASNDIGSILQAILNVSESCVFATFDQNIVEQQK